MTQRTTLNLAAVVAGAIALAVIVSGTSGEARAIAVPAPLVSPTEPGRTAVAVFAGGCFWGVEAVFEHVKGVRTVTSGYAGGTAATATYDQVSRERTRHAEAVRIVYDPQIVSYTTLMRVFFSAVHDPTQVNRQGHDVGPSYRSAIFPQSPAQQTAAAAYLAQLGRAKVWQRPLATRLEQGRFFAAEAYHQDFMRRNPAHPYIRQWDAPKLAAFRAAYPGLRQD